MPDGRATDLPATPLEADRGPAPGGAYAGGERPPVVRRARPPRRSEPDAGPEADADLESEADGEGTPVGRRVVLGMVGLGALGILVGERVQDTIERALRPVSRNDPTGLTSYVPTGGRFRIYSVTSTMPSRSAGEYRLRVDGLVDRPLDLSYDELLDLPQTEMVRDFQCVTGWRVPDVPWQGVRVSALLDRAGVQSGATHLRLYSFDGAYTESLTLDQARRDDVIVAHRMMGGPVSREHGGPVRLYVAPMYGYKSLKWLERIEVVDRLVPGYWEERGYEVDAWVGESNGRRDEPIET